jgi:hypothetical protein
MTPKSKAKKTDLRIIAGIIAAKAIQGFDKGGRVVGLTNGEFSLLSLITELLKITGKADITISTWSAGIYDATSLNELLECGKINSVKLILDRSFKTRQSGYAVYIDEVFKPENIRTTNTHAKFVLIKNEEYSICIRSSMNLNENKRCENFDIDDNIEIYQFFKDFADKLFDNQPKGIIEDRKTIDPIFDMLFGQQHQKPQDQTFGKTMGKWNE